jgi:radical SAM protein (TIGR04043 family)
MQPRVEHIKTEIQSLGIRLDLPPERQGGAGPAEGNTVVFGGVVATVPTASHFVAASPYCLRSAADGMVLLKDNREIIEVDVVHKPKFYERKDRNGVPYWTIALLHGINCLATTTVQRCIYWENPRTRCRFCGIELSLLNGSTIAVKNPEVLAEVAGVAQALDHIQHVTLTTGTWPESDKGIRQLARCALAIKEATGLPVHVQFEPPDDLELLRELKESLVDTVGIHIETFDMKALQKIAPAKYALGLEHYLKAWKFSVSLFGANQVSSFLLAGLGETEASIMRGSKVLADLGVYPFVVPLRPIPGSLMADTLPPSAAAMMRIYEQVSSMLTAQGLAGGKSKAGCVRCGACSALPDFE